MRRPLLARNASLLLLGVLLCLLATLSLTMPHKGAAEGPSEGKVERLIEELGSDRFQTREAATRALMELEDEPPVLRKALKSPAPEVRRRVARILEAYIPKRARRGLAKAQALAKEGRVDEMAERLVLWKEWNRGKERCKSVAELAAGVAEWEHHAFCKAAFLYKFHLPFSARHSLDNPVTPRELAEWWTRSSDLRGSETASEIRKVLNVACTVIVTSENVCIRTIRSGIIIAGGSIQLESATDSVIICDGDFEAKKSLSGSLIIARGEVKCPLKVGFCTILSEGSIVLPEGANLPGCAILSKGIPNCPVKFFDPALVGLTVWQLYRDGHPLPDGGQLVDDQERPALGDGVWIKEVRKDTPFAAGLRAGDVITAIGGTKTPSKDVFRKTLRRKLAEGGPILTFTVRRSGKTLDVSLPVKD